MIKILINCEGAPNTVDCDGTSDRVLKELSTALIPMIDTMADFGCSEFEFFKGRLFQLIENPHR